jgi:biotin/methionine sulfoxide reductase
VEWLGGAGTDRYPLHLLSVKPQHRLHSQMDAGPVSRGSKIAEREPLWIAPADAHARGIADGDVVRVFNDRGAILAGARVTGRMRRAVVLMETGAWYDPVPGSAEALDSHGNPNVLVADRATSRLSQGPNANSCLVQVQKWTGPLPPVRVFSPPEFGTQTPVPGAPR